MDERKIFSYEKIPFNMIGSFRNFECWDTELISACIEFKRKFDKWPTAFLTNDSTYDKWEEVLKEKCENSENEIEFDNFNSTKNTNIENDYWDSYDTNIPLDEIKPEEMPIIWEDTFSTPLFNLELIIDNKYGIGMFRLMYGEEPGTDDGEEIPDEHIKVA